MCIVYTSLVRPLARTQVHFPLAVMYITWFVLLQRDLQQLVWLFGYTFVLSVVCFLCVCSMGRRTLDAPEHKVSHPLGPPPVNGTQSWNLSAQPSQCGVIIAHQRRCARRN